MPRRRGLASTSLLTPADLTPAARTLFSLSPGKEQAEAAEKYRRVQEARAKKGEESTASASGEESGAKEPGGSDRRSESPPVSHRVVFRERSRRGMGERTCPSREGRGRSPKGAGAVSIRKEGRGLGAWARDPASATGRVLEMESRGRRSRGRDTPLLCFERRCRLLGLGKLGLVDLSDQILGLLRRFSSATAFCSSVRGRLLAFGLLTGGVFGSGASPGSWVLHHQHVCDSQVCEDHSTPTTKWLKSRYPSSDNERQAGL